VSRVALIACLAVFAIGCGGDDGDDEQPASAPKLADLRVEVDPDAEGGKPARTREIRCAAAEDSALCARVARIDPADLEPRNDAVACTQQYGRPETATVVGTLRGEPVDLKLARVNGCEIARWKAASALLQ
jgi:hypothetical protein